MDAIAVSTNIVKQIFAIIIFANKLLLCVHLPALINIMGVTALKILTVYMEFAQTTFAN